MENFKSDREMIKEFIKKQIEENDYYERIRNEYSNSDLDKKENMLNKVYSVFSDYYNGYYSVWTILDTIEDYMSQNMGFYDVINSEDFTIKDF